MANTSADVAVVGGGYWGKNLIRNFHQLSALNTIVDTSREALKKYQDLYPEVKVSLSFSETLLDRSVKKVVIATPAVMHYSQAKAALEAGKDVYIEKPISLEVGQAEELVSLADSKKAILMVGHILQYHPIVEHIQELIKEQFIGDVLHINSNRLSLGKLRTEENVLWSFAPHDISMILSFMSSLPQTVNCNASSFLHDGIEDTCQLYLKFSGNRSASISASWISPFKEHKLTIIGTKGALIFDDTKVWDEKLSYSPKMLFKEEGKSYVEKSEAEFIKVDQKEPLLNECSHFLSSCQLRQKPKTSGTEGLEGLRVLDAAQKSLLQSGNMISLEMPKYFAHETACVDNGAEISPGTKIWHFSHIMKGASLGENCNVGQNVVISDGVKIGKQVKIQNNVSVYSGIECEDYVFIGPSVVFTNIKNPRSEINRRSEYVKTALKRGSTIGANATIVCGITIGAYSFIGAGAVVCKEVPPFALVVGNPAKQIGWVNIAGERLGLPISIPEGEYLEESDASGRYVLSGNTLKYYSLDFSENKQESFALNC
ncbi:MAG: Gfo/Idh/MocA family oxidoreductase [Chlamydiales bacterium]|nr:Gfo/Idh/MocA family oxidoreductase [Chlamydiales bacterium]